MAINAARVVAGGLAAGAVLNVMDFVVNTFLLRSQNEAALNALNPSLSANMEGAASITAFVVLDFLLGVMLVWTYAAMRPRFGAGPKTAFIAAIQVWLVAGIIYSFVVALGIFTVGYLALSAVAALVNLGVSAQVGGMVYKEGE